VFAVDVERNPANASKLFPLKLKLYPTRENYSINIMCEDFDYSMQECQGGGTVRGFVAGGLGCTIVGDGANTTEDTITARCDGPLP